MHKAPRLRFALPYWLITVLLVGLASKEPIWAQDGGTRLYLPAVVRPVPMATVVPSPMPSPTPAPNSASNQVVALLNQARVAEGCAPLTINNALSQAALAHSADMAEHDFFSHTGSDGSTPWERLARAGYTYSTAAENIAAGYSSAAQVVSSWMSSAGHRANILNCALHETGVGYVYAANDPGSITFSHYWTEMFGTPR